MQGFRQYNTNNPIDNIVYGDLMLDNKSKITCEDKIINYCFATGLINKFFSLVPPKNSSQETINELLFLERVTNNATQEEINFSTLAEIEEKKCYVNFCKNVLKLDVNTIYFEKIMEQTDPFLMLLKNHFNRPRQYQLAPHYNIQIKFFLQYSQINYNLIYVRNQFLNQANYLVHSVCTKLVFLKN